jgi:hypothetical protein
VCDKRQYRIVCGMVGQEFERERERLRLECCSTFIIESCTDKPFFVSLSFSIFVLSLYRRRRRRRF